ncbi:MAG: alpha/beta hydrolase [Oscillatoria sp. PMC 1051.18]|nr:alpha/beta hydrolase [Oscillatoria sp. PMC 1050.18]MEC5030231.1 alpha/beta hydrolase [Oscillatoria sp. PMC 1051.18]
MEIGAFKYFLAIATGTAISIYLLLCLVLLLWQNRLIFVPYLPVETTPRDIGLAYEEVWLPITAKKGREENLHGWWLPAVAPKIGVLLYLHGNGSNVVGYLSQAQLFLHLGFDVFLFDYRGYGRSQGKFPVEKQVYEDAETAFNYLVEERGISPKEIFVYGFSLGGAIAIELATHHPEIPAMIIQGSFTSLREMSNHKSWYFRLFPVDLLLIHKFDSLSKINSLSMPLFFIHGTSDRTVPAYMSQVLHDAATSPKQLWFVPDAGHNDVASVAGEQYLQKIREFLEMVNSHRTTVKT